MLTIADVSKSYGTRELFSEVSLFIARTDRLGLIAEPVATWRGREMTVLRLME